MNAHDEFMWMLAEQGDEKSIQSFLKRHPEDEIELMHRIKMVRGLVGMRLPEADLPVPKFAAREVRELPSAKPKFSLALAACAICAIGFASYQATSWALNRDDIAKSPALVQPQPEPAETAHAKPSLPEGFDPNQNVVPPPENPPPAQVYLYRLPVSIDLQNATLGEIFSEISRQTGLTIEIGPGLPATTYNVRYQGFSALDLLQDLGGRANFTPFEQSPTKVLIIPARPAEPEPAPETTEPEATPEPVPAPSGPRRESPTGVPPSPGQLPSVN